ncbi:MAG: DUF6282 family protein [Candidatus Micrarchaeia archaeon]
MEKSEYNSTEDQLLQGAIDLHIHASPNVMKTKVDAIEAAVMARDAGMKAIVIKDNWFTSAGTAYLVNRIVSGVDVFGGIVLNFGVGGLNPDAVDTALKYGKGAKIIWMPTSSSMNHLTFFGKKGGLSIFKNGKITTEVRKILDMIAENNLVLATGHLSVKEQKTLVKAAVERGVKKILINHPELELIGMPISVQKELAALGAFMEYCFVNCTPGITLPIKAYGGVRFNYVEPSKIAKMIREIGAEHCIMSTDLGSLRTSPTPVDGMKMFICAMLELGISESEIEHMTKINPSILLYGE